MTRQFDLYLHDIIDAIDHVMEYTEGMSLLELSGNRMRIDAVVRELQIIGEAVTQLPTAIKARHPEVPWADVTAFRNAVVHRYWSVDVEILWTIINGKLKPLRKQIAVILKQETRSAA